MNFAMPNASKVEILANTNLKKQTDLFGALHSVKINLGVVKTGVMWDVLILIEDTYDFKEEEYNGLVNVVNNIANYEQERGRVRPYKLFITADKPRLTTLPFGVPLW